MQKNQRVVLAALATCLSFSASLARAQAIVAGFTPGSFRTTETGAAEYRVALRVPPGIAGLEPVLAIAYNSQGGNGLLGTGFGLGGLSVIHRCSKTIVGDGQITGVNFDGNDRYCLDGQRLVAVSGAYGANGTEYRTERESFAKVVSNGGAGSDPTWFKVWTKAGQVMEYGNTVDSRIEAQGKAQARVWALNKVSDRKGNYLTVAYAEDNANGDYSPARIDYAGNAGASVTPFASVRFTYEARSDAKPNYVSGSVIKTMNRLTSIKTYVGETAVTDYRLTYEYSPNGGPSRLTSITECSGNGAQCFPPTTFSWQNPGGDSLAASSYPGFGGLYGPKLADVNGDGLVDLVGHGSNDEILVRYSTGSGFQGPTQIGTLPVVGTNGGECSCENVLGDFTVGDLDGNGRADMLFTNGTALLSTASGFSLVSWAGGPGNLSNVSVADFDGDGRSDVLTAIDGDLYIRYSTGSGFQSPVYIGSRPVAGYNPEDNSPVYAAYRVGDFDGNGRADIAIGGGTTFLSKPGGFVQVSWPGGPVKGVVGDLNGDGRADLIDDVTASLIVVRYSNGAGFDAEAAIAYPPTDPNSGDPASWMVGDLDGNGRTDILFSTSTSWMSRAGSPDLVSSVTTSLGSQIAISYKALTDGSVYAKDSDAVWPTRDLQQQGPLYVVSSSSATNGIGGSRVTNYYYRGAKVHMTGGGFLGFRQVEATDAATGLKSVSTTRQDYPYHGLPAQTQRKQSNDTLIAQAASTWTTAVLTPATGSGGNYHKVDLAQGVESGYELNGALITTATTSTTYDSYGNALTVTTGTGDGYSKVTTNTYEAPNTSDWILGRLATASVTSNMPSPGVPLTRTSSFAYDSASGFLTKEVVEPSNSNLCLVTTYSYDGFGNKTSATTRTCNGSTGEAATPSGDAVFTARTSTTSFAATTANPTPGQFPTSSANALTQAEAKEFDARFGVVTKLTGPNALATTWTYDLFGRKLVEARADSTTTTWTYTVCGTCPTNGRYFVTVTSSGQPTASTYFDSLNREIRSESQGFDGTLVRKDTEYNSLGQTLRVSRPYYLGQTPQWTTFTYDLVGRVLTATEPNSAVTSTVYNGLITTTTNALSQTETRTKNSQGQLVQVTRQ